MAASLIGSSRSRPLTDDIVRAELIKVVIDGSTLNLGAGISVAILVAGVIPGLDGSSSKQYWLWCAAVALVMLHGIWMARRARQFKQDTARILRYGRRLATHGIYAGVVWGGSAWILLPLNSSMAEALLATTMAMVVMAGAGNNAAHREMLLGFALCFALLFATGLARFGDRYHVALANAFVIYTLVTIFVARNQGIAVRRQVLANLENQALRTIAETERARADSASQAKTAFLAAASHDLRQPLHALVQYSAHLNRANHDSQLHDTVRGIDCSLDAMRDLLDSILDLSKLMIGGVQPVVAAFPIGSLLERLDAQLRPLAVSKGLQFVAKPAVATVMSDDVLLERILRNLILNAIRYTSNGQVTVRCRLRRNALQVQVWDTGIGIPRQELSRIFDAFYQVGNRGRDRHKGLGLGLAIVRQLCDLLAHRVQVRTKVGVGTVFVVSVPLSTNPMVIPPRQPSDTSARDYVRGAFVVLVDDDKLSRDASEHTLKAFGCRVVAVASHKEAIEKLRNQEFAPQVIVADYRLEAATGIEAIATITENLRVIFGKTFSIPALVVSGDTAPDELRRVNDHGYRMLHKPVASDDLWHALNHLLERKAEEIEF